MGIVRFENGARAERENHDLARREREGNGDARGKQGYLRRARPPQQGRQSLNAERKRADAGDRREQNRNGDL